MPSRPVDARGFGTQDVETLYAELEKPMYNVLLRRLWEPEEAEEVVQEAFVRLWAMRTRVEPATVRPLVWKIALNLASRRRRWKALRSWFSLDGLAGGDRADHSLGDAQVALRVREAVEALPDELREVMLLCAYAELSYAEVGSILGVPEGTVGSRRNRALAQLQHVLGEVNDG